MSLYRHKRSPFWQYDFEIDGNRFSGSTRLRDESDAQSFEEARKAEAQGLVDRLSAEGRGPMRFKAAADRWWSEHGSTIADSKNKAVLERLAELIGPKKYLHAITDDDVTKMVTERRKDTRRDSTDARGRILRRPIKAATVNRTLDLLRRIMNRAQDNWNATIVRMPVWKKHRLAEAKGHVRELSTAEEAKLDEAESFDYAEVRRFAIITGLRRRAVLLRWPQVDFELGVVRVFSKGKARVIPLTQEAYQMLWRRRGHHAEWVFTYQATRTWKKRPHGGEPRIRGERYPITYAGLGSNKRKWAKAGVKLRIHDLRHTTGMRTLRKTGNLKLVQVLLGHSDIKTTATFYTDATLEDLRAGMETTAPREIPAAPRRLEDKGKK